MGFHVKVIQDILDMIGKALNVRLEVFRNVVGIVAQLLQRELTDVIKPIAGNFVHALRRVIGIFVVFGYDIRLCLCQSALKATYDRHRDDDITILIRHIGATQLIGNAPDEIGFFADIYWIIILKYIDLLLVSHLKSSYTHMQAILLDSLYMQNF